MMSKEKKSSERDPEVQEMLDRQAILKVLYTYCKGLDRFDYDLLNSCWWPDGTDDHGIFKGTGKEFCDWVFPFLKTTMERTQHNVLNYYIEIRGDRARSECNFIIWHRMLPGEDRQYDAITAGRYVDDFERREGVWKIKHRQVVYDWDRLDPVNTYFGDGFEVIRGVRGKDDYSYSSRNW